MEKDCGCNLNKAMCEASEEELSAFYEKITGSKPKPEQIKAMKGLCKLEPGIEIGKAPTAAALADIIIPELLKSVKEEYEAQEVYAEREGHAARLGDKKTSDLYAHIKGEEINHAEEFKERKKELEPGK